MVGIGDRFFIQNDKESYNHKDGSGKQSCAVRSSVTFQILFTKKQGSNATVERIHTMDIEGSG